MIMRAIINCIALEYPEVQKTACDSIRPNAVPFVKFEPFNLFTISSSYGEKLPGKSRFNSSMDSPVRMDENLTRGPVPIGIRTTL